MSALTENQIIGITLAIICLALFAIWILRAMGLRRKRFLKEMRGATAESPGDAAHNQILTTRAILDRLESQGNNVAAPRALLEEAQEKFDAGRYAPALQLARQARSMLNTQATTGGSPSSSRVRVPVGTPRKAQKEEMLYRDIAQGNRRSPRGGTESPASRSMDDSEIPEPDPSASGPTIPELRKTVPKNQLESRFEINLLVESLEGRPESAFPEARKLLTAARRSFERADYSEALRLALRGRKALGTGTEETITLSPGTLVENPPETPLPSAARSSAPSAAGDVVPEPDTGGTRSTTVRCSRCDQENPASNKFCRGCGKPLAEPVCPRCQKPILSEDAFCGVCGAPITGGA